MKYRLLIFFLTLILAINTVSVTVSAEEYTETVGEVQSLIDGITDYKLEKTGSADIQEWIDNSLSETAGVSGEWYAFALCRDGNYVFSAYTSALLRYVKENEIRSAVTRQKYALILMAIGIDDSFIDETLDATVGELGVMSVVYGLHLINNGAESENADADTVIENLLSLQKNDGGWAVMGDASENDATAMAVQALSPYYGERDDVTEAVDKAVMLLSERQLEGGDFSSYGVANAESTAQVIVMLTSLGIDPLTDTRFIKNGNTLLNGLDIYLCSDGSYSHEAGADTSENATVQAFYTMVSLKRFYEGKSPLYIFEKEEPAAPEISEEPLITEESETETEETEPPAEEETAVGTEKKADYKPVACIIIVALGAVCVVVLMILKKGRKQNLAVLGAITAAAVLFVIFTDFQSADNYYSGDNKVKDNPIGTVTLSIRCDTVVGKSDAEYIPADGIILSDSFLIEENETVLDILIEAAKKHNIQLDYSGAADTVYFRGINYLYEFDFGDLSGWLYHVNGSAPSVGCDGYILSDGDNIEWLYTCEMGNDLK